MFTLTDYDNMMPDTVIAQGTGMNGPGDKDNPIPVLGEVMQRSSFSWVATRKKGGWQININGNPLPVRNRAMIQKLVPCSDEALTFYLYTGV